MRFTIDNKSLVQFQIVSDTIYDIWCMNMVTLSKWENMHLKYFTTLQSIDREELIATLLISSKK